MFYEKMYFFYNVRVASFHIYQKNRFFKRFFLSFSNFYFENLLP